MIMIHRKFDNGPGGMSLGERGRLAGPSSGGDLAGRELGRSQQPNGGWVLALGRLHADALLFGLELGGQGFFAVYKELEPG